MATAPERGKRKRSLRPEIHRAIQREAEAFAAGDRGAPCLQLRCLLTAALLEARAGKRGFNYFGRRYLFKTTSFDRLIVVDRSGRELVSSGYGSLE